MITVLTGRHRSRDLNGNKMIVLFNFQNEVLLSMLVLQYIAALSNRWDVCQFVLSKRFSEHEFVI